MLDGCGVLAAERLCEAQILQSGRLHDGEAAPAGAVDRLLGAVLGDGAVALEPQRAAEVDERRDLAARLAPPLGEGAIAFVNLASRREIAPDLV